MRSKHELKVARKERDEANEIISHLKNELKLVVDDLPDALAEKLPDGRRMPTPGNEKINARAKRELEKLIYKRWRRQGPIWDWGDSDSVEEEDSRSTVREMVEVPLRYRHDLA